MKLRLPLAGALLLCGMLWLPGSPALGQSQTDLIFLQDRISRLESQIQSLQNLRGGGGAVAGGNAGSASIAVRLDGIEERLRNLTGLAEQNAHQLRQLEDRMRRMAEDTEFRFQEQGAVGGSLSQAPVRQSFNTQPLPPASTSSATIRPNSLGTSQGTLGTLQGGPININPIVQSGPIGQSGPILQSNNFQLQNQNAGQVPFGVSVDPRGAYDIAYAYILQRDFDAAEGAFSGFLRDHPNSELAGNAKYWLGETFFARSQFRSAADAFLKSYTEHRSGRKAPDSLLKLGMSLQQLGQTSAACSTFAELIGNYPNSGDIRARAIQEQQSARC
ncbi:MAG: tol-pal system protein YbgF [Rhizobiales bacterium]|nr:tol-pal system protein YbgF [Hyphomicrobiales bacterium]